MPNGRADTSHAPRRMGIAPVTVLIAVLLLLGYYSSLSSTRLAPSAARIDATPPDASAGPWYHDRPLGPLPSPSSDSSVDVSPVAEASPEPTSPPSLRHPITPTRPLEGARASHGGASSSEDLLLLKNLRRSPRGSRLLRALAADEAFEKLRTFTHAGRGGEGTASSSSSAEFSPPSHPTSSVSDLSKVGGDAAAVDDDDVDSYYYNGDDGGGDASYTRYPLPPMPPQQSAAPASGHQPSHHHPNDPSMPSRLGPAMPSLAAMRRYYKDVLLIVMTSPSREHLVLDIRRHYSRFFRYIVFVRGGGGDALAPSAAAASFTQTHSHLRPLSAAEQQRLSNASPYDVVYSANLTVLRREGPHQQHRHHSEDQPPQAREGAPSDNNSSSTNGDGSNTKAGAPNASTKGGSHTGRPSTNGLGLPPYSVTLGKAVRTVQSQRDVLDALWRRAHPAVTANGGSSVHVDGSSSSPYMPLSTPEGVSVPSLCATPAASFPLHSPPSDSVSAPRLAAPSAVIAYEERIIGVNTPRDFLMKGTIGQGWYGIGFMSFIAAGEVMGRVELLEAMAMGGHGRGGGSRDNNNSSTNSPPLSDLPPLHGGGGAATGGGGGLLDSEWLRAFAPWLFPPPSSDALTSDPCTAASDEAAGTPLNRPPAAPTNNNKKRYRGARWEWADGGARLRYSPQLRQLPKIAGVLYLGDDFVFMPWEPLRSAYDKAAPWTSETGAMARPYRMADPSAGPDAVGHREAEVYAALRTVADGTSFSGAGADLNAPNPNEGAVADVDADGNKAADSIMAATRTSSLLPAIAAADGTVTLDLPALLAAPPRPGLPSEALAAFLAAKKALAEGSDLIVTDAPPWSYPSRLPSAPLLSAGEAEARADAVAPQDNIHRPVRSADSPLLSLLVAVDSPDPFQWEDGEQMCSAAAAAAAHAMAPAGVADEGAGADKNAVCRMSEAEASSLVHFWAERHRVTFVRKKGRGGKRHYVPKTNLVPSILRGMGEPMRVPVGALFPLLWRADPLEGASSSSSSSSSSSQPSSRGALVRHLAMSPFAINSSTFHRVPSREVEASPATSSVALPSSSVFARDDSTSVAAGGSVPFQGEWNNNAAMAKAVGIVIDRYFPRHYEPLLPTLRHGRGLAGVAEEAEDISPAADAAEGKGHSAAPEAAIDPSAPLDSTCIARAEAIAARGLRALRGRRGSAKAPPHGAGADRSPSVVDDLLPLYYELMREGHAPPTAPFANPFGRGSFSPHTASDHGAVRSSPPLLGFPTPREPLLPPFSRRAVMAAARRLPLRTLAESSDLRLQLLHSEGDTVVASNGEGGVGSNGGDGLSPLGRRLRRAYRSFALPTTLNDVGASPPFTESAAEAPKYTGARGAKQRLFISADAFLKGNNANASLLSDPVAASTLFYSIVDAYYTPRGVFPSYVWLAFVGGYCDCFTELYIPTVLHTLRSAYARAVATAAAAVAVASPRTSGQLGEGASSGSGDSGTPRTLMKGSSYLAAATTDAVRVERFEAQYYWEGLAMDCTRHGFFVCPATEAAAALTEEARGSGSAAADSNNAPLPYVRGAAQRFDSKFFTDGPYVRKGVAGIHRCRHDHSFVRRLFGTSAERRWREGHGGYAHPWEAACADRLALEALTFEKPPQCALIADNGTLAHSAGGPCGEAVENANGGDGHSGGHLAVPAAYPPPIDSPSEWIAQGFWQRKGGNKDTDHRDFLKEAQPP